MKFENLFINHSLKNGTIADFKANPDIVGFIIAGLDHGFKAELPGCVLMKYGKIIIGCHTSGTDRLIWICHRNEKEVLRRFKIEAFRWDNVELYKGCLYYEKQFICKTT